MAHDLSLVEVNRYLYGNVYITKCPMRTCTCMLYTAGRGSMRCLCTLYTYRPTGGVLGFTCETVIALTTNIESREYVRRTQNTPEHPRASSTDDVECLFSIMRDLAGKHFTLRTWNYNWHKVCLELSKRLDPHLGFYYHTSSHDCFYEGERPSFDRPGKSLRNPRTRRVRRRELLTDFVFERATLPEAGATSVRLQFHNVPVELPPPLSSVNPLSDHTYTI